MHLLYPVHYFYDFIHSFLTCLFNSLPVLVFTYLFDYLQATASSYIYLWELINFFVYPNSYASVVLEDLFGSRKELIDLDSIGKLLPFFLIYF